MTEAIREQLSAFVDGELSPVEAELLLKRVERDPALRSALDRYMLLGAAIRSDTSGSPSRDFAARVAGAIDKEQRGVASVASWAARLRRKRSGDRWAKPAMGGAVAACVVALAMLFVPRLSNDGVPVSGGGVIASTDGAVVSPVNGATGTGPTVIPAEAVRASQLRQQLESRYSNELPVLQVDGGNRLATYMMAHSQYSSPLSRRNVLTGLLADEVSDEAVVENGASVPDANPDMQAERAIAIR